MSKKKKKQKKLKKFSFIRLDTYLLKRGYQISDFEDRGDFTYRFTIFSPKLRAKQKS